MCAMDGYKLTYFNLRGIAEPIRMIFKYVNIPFEEKQVNVNNWKAIHKTEFKWQMLPYLEYNGKVLTQSGAILRFLGQKFGLVPEDIWEQAKCDEIYGAAYDLRNRFEPFIEAKFEGNAEVTNELRDKLVNSSVPLILSNLNELLEEIRESNKESDTDFIFGGMKPTWIDFCLANFMEMFANGLDDPNLLDKYPMLEKQQKSVYNIPAISKWITERPETFI